MYLGELSYPVTELKGIGKASATLLGETGITTVTELLSRPPRTWRDYSTEVPLKKGFDGTPVNTVVEVVAHDYFGRGYKKVLKVYVRDATAGAALLCFNRNFLAKVLTVGKKFYLYGTFSYSYGELQSSSFETEPYGIKNPKFGTIEPVYPLSGTLTQAVLRKAVRDALQRYGKWVEDELPQSLIHRYSLMSKATALQRLHFPKTLEDITEARRTLAFEELFHFQLTAARKRTRPTGDSGRRAPLSGDASYVDTTPPAGSDPSDGSSLPETLQKKALELLPFSLTEDQHRVIEEIQGGLESPRPMSRLLQGDVGSGKTLVALLSALPIIEAGGQAAFLAPTELLARQHGENAAALLEPLGISIALLHGGLGRRKKTPLLTALESGEVDLIIGTHALFTEEVQFKSLRFVIIDEQHKFGVEQRARMMAKGETPNLLLMTATPIPRTLTLTFFGDIDVSTIRTMPPGRKPVITHLARRSNEAKVYAAVRKELERGMQAYFVYPRIDGGTTGSGVNNTAVGEKQEEQDELKDAESMGEYLKKRIFPDFQVEIIHSRVPEEEKSYRMRRFVAGETQVLVATSVVEVGVDVSSATCMIVEHAERFGLASLHQLRGRVGRGKEQSYAFLVYSNSLTEEGKQRLMVMKRSSDGFVIAEEDLKLRGPGEPAGIRQSGYLRFSFADLSKDLPLLEKAREEAFAVVSSDPGLLNPEHASLREIVHRCPPFSEDIFLGG
ncbi:MAG: ATP-dependent DNA helicase RecG [Spirochaetia bacterium]